MMTPEKEKRLATEMRLVARQYCDGAFNKIEYRRRRREILKQCIEQDMDTVVQKRALPAEEAAPAQTQKSITPKRDWAPYLMVGLTLVVLGVMGFLLMSMV